MPVVTTIKRLTWYRLLRHLRKARDRRFPPKAPVDYDLNGPAANDRMRRLLEAPEPCLIARFGNNELRTVENLLSIEAPGGLGRKLRRYLGGEGGPWWWDARTAREMLVVAGFYPASPENLERFARLTLEDCREIDLLGSWLPAETMVRERMKAVRIPLFELEPYFHPDPWSQALAGRKVLVIHPFDKSIHAQYGRREALFKDPLVLPAFELQTFRTVQSFSGDCRFKDWFEALAWMQEGIAALDFDIAIIGAGAYGMPLGAFIKRELGRKAIHLGGATQILFGIKGRRWDQWPDYATGLYNEAWTRPLEDERPATAGKVEGGSYW